MNKLYTALTLFIMITCLSCTGSKRKRTIKELASSPSINVSHRSYSVYVPKGWTTYDTSLEGLKIRFLLAPIVKGRGRTNINILNEAMSGRDGKDYIDASIYDLKSSVEDFHLTGRNNFQAAGLKGIWFSYSKRPSGVSREAINYTIFSNDVAYILTATTDSGNLNTYRSLFDSVAKSFKFKN